MKITTTLLLICSFFINLNAQSFVAELLTDESQSSQGILFYDFNGDGVNEIINTQFSQDKVILIKQEGGLLVQEELLSVDGPIRVGLGDYNQDGLQDIVVIHSNSSGIRVLKNQGNLEFTKQTLNSFDFEKGREFASHDLDLDGDLDLVVGSPINDEIYLFEMENPSFWDFDVSVIDNDMDNVGEISVGDFDDDGLPDLVACARFGKDVNVYINQGNLNFNKMQKDLQVSPYGNATRDFNNDGLIDFAVTDFAGAMIVYTNNGDNSFEEVLVDFDISAASGIESLDYNDDGYLDLAVSYGQGIAIYENSGTNSVDFVRENIVIGDLPGDFYVSDYDNDGDLDIMASVPSAASIYLFTNQTYELVDNDNDGYFSDVDCDDENEDVNPGQVEVVYNGLDDDCDPATLDDDLDQDGFVLADDCDDTNFDINPDAMEVPYNGVDDDCNALTLDDDLDGDGFLNAEDCDDFNEDINPDATEIPNNGIDEDCDGKDLIISVKELANTLINIYPNPVASYFVIEGAENLDIRIEIYDLAGKLMLQERNTNIIYTNGMADGTYLLKVVDIETSQFVVDKITIAK